MMPGAGAVAAAVETATGKAPEIYAGKPSAFLLELLRGNGVDMARTLVVGDRLDTDVAFGRSGGRGSPSSPSAASRASTTSTPSSRTRSRSASRTPS